MRNYSTDAKQRRKESVPIALRDQISRGIPSRQRFDEPHSSDGTPRGNPVCATLENEVLIACGDIGHLEVDWLATGGKPFFVIRHCENLTVPTDKNVNVWTDTLNRMFADEASNAGTEHFRPHAESAHFCFECPGAKFKMVLHHRCIVFHLAATSNVVYREPFVLDDRIEVRGCETNNAGLRHPHRAGIRRYFRINLV